MSNVQSVTAVTASVSPAVVNEAADIMRLKARIEELELQAAAMKPKPRALTFQVGQKKGVTVFGLGRFGVTLYYEQWVRLLAVVEPLRAFMESHKSELAIKA